MSLNVLVTGGAGFIGSHTIVELMNVGHKVICVDNCYNAYLAEGEKFPESLKRVREITGKSLKFYLVDIRDKKELDGVFKRVWKKKSATLIKIYNL
jgi:UDP-glucose 4-epimerase